MAMDGLRHVLWRLGKRKMQVYCSQQAGVGQGIHSSIRDYSTLMKKTFGQHPAYSTVRKVLFQAPAKASPHQPVWRSTSQEKARTYYTTQNPHNGGASTVRSALQKQSPRQSFGKIPKILSRTYSVTHLTPLFVSPSWQAFSLALRRVHNRSFMSCHGHLTSKAGRAVGHFWKCSIQTSRQAISSSFRRTTTTATGHPGGATGGPAIAPTPILVSPVIIRKPAIKSPFLQTIRARLGVTPRLLLFLGHFASLFGVLALFMKDMLYLRLFMVCGSCCGVLFNLLQPTPLKIPAIWGCVFISLNMFQIIFLLHERRPVHFKDEEAEVYEAVFQRHGVTPHQFEKLMRHAGAQWRDLPAGHMVLKEGDFVDTVSVVVSGRGEVWREGEVVGEVKKGNLVGETSLLAKAHQTGHTVVTSEPTRIVCWPRLKLGQVLTEDKSLLLSAAQMINSDLSVKLANSAHLSSRTAILQTYEEVLHGICADGVIQPAEKRALREYRTRHHITQAQHLEALSKCGWSPVEFEDGMMLRNSKVSSKPFFSIKRSINNFNENVAKVAAATHGASKAPTSHEVDENIGSSKPTSTSTELPPSKGQQPVTKEAV